MTKVTSAPTLNQVQPSLIREVANIAFEMNNADPGSVLRLQFGESTMPTPDFIKQAACQALEEGFTFYSENAGLPSLRQAIADKYAELHAVEIDPAREIVVTASGVQALNVAIRCAIDPGDEALILSPNWPNATEIVRMFGARPVEVPLVVARGIDGARFTIDFDALTAAIAPRTRLLVVTSPSNPLGWTATPVEQQALLDFARQHGLWLMADEVYERIYYSEDGVAPSFLRLCTRNDAVIITQSFSKSYRMTGWRLGWLVAREDVAYKAGQMNEFIVSHAASFTQKAGEVALRQGEAEISAMLELFRARMAFCYDALSAMEHISVPKPEGAFYLFPRVTGLENSYDFALQLLQEENVAVAPGSAFGKGGEGAFRICYAPDMDVLEQAMVRLARFMARRQA